VLGDPAKRTAWDGARAPQRPREAAPPAAPRAARPAGPEPPLAIRVLSRFSWLLLSLVFRLVGSVALLLLGPLAAKLSREDLDRKAPVLSDFVFPVGRILLFGGLALLVAQKLWGIAGSPRAAVILIIAGVATFVLERVALAWVWAFGQGSRPRDRC
jgi:hypothetical protein